LLALGDLGVIISDLQLIVGCLLTALDTSLNHLCQVNPLPLIASGDDLLARSSLDIIGTQVCPETSLVLLTC
jgi:hypothetical protein